jgi:hypothetical protein
VGRVATVRAEAVPVGVRRVAAVHAEVVPVGVGRVAAALPNVLFLLKRSLLLGFV